MKCDQCGGNIHSERGCLLCPMFEACAPPLIHTEATMFVGMAAKQANQFNTPLQKSVGEALAKDLRGMGGSTTGKVYLSGLASYPGDPEAWVSGKSDIERVAKERNLTVEGDVNRKADSRKDDQPTVSKKPSKKYQFDM